MKNYEFEIIEELSKLVKVRAQDEESAYLKIKSMYDSEEIVLCYGDHIHTSFKTPSSISSEKEKNLLILDIINYLYADEEKHYEEFDENKPRNHIFMQLKRLKELL